MEFNVETFISPANLATLRRAGLHKVAGAMTGTGELTVKHAASIIGTKAFLRRRETQKIAAGLKALADVTETKVADTVWGPLLQRAMLPAAGGMLISAMPQIMSGQEIDPGQVAVGGALGALGGMGNAMHQAARRDPAATAAYAKTLRPQY